MQYEEVKVKDDDDVRSDGYRNKTRGSFFADRSLDVRSDIRNYDPDSVFALDDPLGPGQSIRGLAPLSEGCWCDWCELKMFMLLLLSTIFLLLLVFTLVFVGRTRADVADILAVLRANETCT